MKRDMDLVRELLLAIECEGTPTLRDMPKAPPASDLEVGYHIGMLVDAGLLSAVDLGEKGSEEYGDIALTWEGHEFLETVRDPQVWSTAKAGAKKIGSFSIGVLVELAKAAAVTKAQSLGFPIGPI